MNPKNLIIKPLSYRGGNLTRISDNIISANPLVDKVKILHSEEISPCFYHYEIPELSDQVNAESLRLWLECDIVPKNTNDLYLILTSEPVCEESGDNEHYILGQASPESPIAWVSTNRMEKNAKNIDSLIRGITAVALHELGEQAGLEHHDILNDSGYSCPMGTGHSALEDDDKYCKACHEKLLSNIY